MFLFRLVMVMTILHFFVSRVGYPGEMYVGFWNVENLFDTLDDPKVELDEEFTPAAAKQWSEERLEIKLDNLSKVIRLMNGGKGPDVLGLCEVENKAVVEMLVRKLKSLGRDYRIIHQDSPSARGIDCALIHDAKTVKLVSQPMFHAMAGIDTRDVIEAKFDAGGNRFTTFVNHWPSQRSPEEVREKVAGVVRKRLDQLLKDDPNADIVLVGDFNALPDAPSVSKRLRTWGDPKKLQPGVFFNSSWAMHASKVEGTYYYQDRWEVLDQVILSPGMLDGKGVNWIPDSTKPVKEKFMLFVPRDPKLKSRPSRSYTGDRFHPDGYSDHLPMSCRLSF